MQIDSTEKVDQRNYFSGFTGSYQCQRLPQSIIIQLSYSGIYFGQSGNGSLNVVESTTNCHNAINGCSDRKVHCTRGSSQSQAYRLELPNRETGRFSDPILGSNLNRAFELKRIFTHSRIIPSHRYKCYSEMSGIYIAEYLDSTYDITPYSSLGYIISMFSAARNSDGTFQQSTLIGEFDGTFFTFLC